jgi:hypothetical protein
MSSVVERVESLEHWRNGNGQPGAAAILVTVRERLCENEARDDIQDAYIEAAKTATAVAKASEKQMLVDAVEEVMKKRGKSAEGIIRALGPYFAAICALIAAALSLGGKP